MLQYSCGGKWSVIGIILPWCFSPSPELRWTDPLIKDSLFGEWSAPQNIIVWTESVLSTQTSIRIDLLNSRANCCHSWELHSVMGGSDRNYNACMALNNVYKDRWNSEFLTLKKLLTIIFWSRKTFYKLLGLLSNYVFYITHAECTLMPIDMFFPLWSCIRLQNDKATGQFGVIH